MNLKSTHLAALVTGLLLIVLVAGYYVTVADSPAVQIPKNHTVTDIAGRSVNVPVTVNRVACIHVTSYETLLLLGQTDKLALVASASKENRWALKLIPNLSKIPDMTSYKDPNLEELIKNDIDVVFFWDYPKPLEKMTSAGIPVIVTSVTLTDNGKKPESIEEFRNFIKKGVRVIGDVLGPDARKNAEKYNVYYDKKIDFVLSRTRDIPADQRPKVYYVRGPGALSTHGKGSNTQWEVEIAGGNFVSKNTSGHIYEASMEEVMNWNPDIIIVGRNNSTKVVTDDPKWKTIKAVTEGKVILGPQGGFSWDYSNEGVLFTLWMAKTFYPDKFQDVDMKTEVREFYQEFYGYHLTDDEVNRILNHQDPA